MHPNTIDTTAPNATTFSEPDCCPDAMTQPDPAEIVWASMPSAADGRISFAEFFSRVVVTEEPDYDTTSMVDPIIELCRPHNKGFAEFKQEFAQEFDDTGVFSRCLCPECLVLRGGLMQNLVKEGSAIPRLGECVRAFVLPDPRSGASLYIDGELIWTKRPDPSGRVLLSPGEVVPTYMLKPEQPARLIVEPPAEGLNRDSGGNSGFKTEHVVLTPEACKKLPEMDFGIYQNHVCTE